MFTALIFMWQRDFLYNLFGISDASFTLIGVFFFSLKIFIFDFIENIFLFLDDNLLFKSLVAFVFSYIAEFFIVHNHETMKIHVFERCIHLNNSSIMLENLSSIPVLWENLVLVVVSAQDISMAFS